MRPPAVDIVIDNYNYGRYLGAAIESALDQTHPRMRVTVVDDGSTDDSLAVARAYGARIRVIAKDNGGQASALNAGAVATDGELVAFLDADDVLTADFAAGAVDALGSRPDAVKVVFRASVIDAQGAPTGRVEPPLHLPLAEGDIRAQTLSHAFDLTWPPLSAHVFRRSALAQILPIPEDDFRTLADWYLAHATSLLGQVVALERPGAGYRLHGANAYLLGDSGDSLRRSAAASSTRSARLPARSNRPRARAHTSGPRRGLDVDGGAPAAVAASRCRPPPAGRRRPLEVVARRAAGDPAANRHGAARARGDGRLVQPHGARAAAVRGATRTAVPGAGSPRASQQVDRDAARRGYIGSAMTQIPSAQRAEPTRAIGDPAQSMAVVICAYTEERWDELVAAVASVRAQRLPAREIVVVVDHNPSLLTRAAAQLPGTLVVENHQGPGLCGGRNTGVDVDPRADRRLPRRRRRRRRAVAGGAAERVRRADDARRGRSGAAAVAHERPPWFTDEFNWVVGCTWTGMAEPGGAIRNPIGANFSVRREVIEAVGGFDARLSRRVTTAGVMSGTADETEFCIRARRHRPDGDFRFAAAARVHHHVPPSRATWRFYRQRCRVEGAAKAVLTQLAGAGAGLSSERRYVRTVLPRAVWRELRSGRSIGALRAGASSPASRSPPAPTRRSE